MKARNVIIASRQIGKSELVKQSIEKYMSIENCNEYLKSQGKGYPRTCKECGLNGCKHENQLAFTSPLKKPRLWQLSKQDYDQLKVSGMMFELHPEATGDWDYDCGSFQEELQKNNKLKPISSAPKNRYILLAGDSGYSNTSLRFESGKWSEYKKDWVNHAGERFTDGGAQPTHWTEIPSAEVEKKGVVEWMATEEFKDFVFIDSYNPKSLYTKEEFTAYLLNCRVQVKSNAIKKLLNK